VNIDLKNNEEKKAFERAKTAEIENLIDEYELSLFEEENH